MNLEKMFVWITTIVIAFATAGKLDVLQNWIWRAQSKIVYESRTSTWGSPRFLQESKDLYLARGAHADSAQPSSVSTYIDPASRVKTRRAPDIRPVKASGLTAIYEDADTKL